MARPVEAKRPRATKERRSPREPRSTPPNVEFAADDLAAASKFARSVGGIEKAQALLAHLRTAKEIAPLHSEGL